MLPFLEVENINQKSAIKHKKSTHKKESNGDSFTEMFASLSEKNKKSNKSDKKDPIKTDKTIIKDNTHLTKEVKTQKHLHKDLQENLPENPQENPKDNLYTIFKEIPKNLLQDPSKEYLNIPPKNTLQNTDKQTNDILTRLDKKYNLTPIQNLSAQKPQSLNSAKDLLELSKHNQNKTLKELAQVAENLELNLQKITLNPQEIRQTTKKNLPFLDENPSLQIANLKKELPNHKEITQQITQKPKDSIFNSILQDKDLLKNPKKEVKNPLKDTKNPSTQNHTELTDIKDFKTPKTKEPIKNDATKQDIDIKVESKTTPKDSKQEKHIQDNSTQIVESKTTKENNATKIESKLEKTTQETPIKQESKIDSKENKTQADTNPQEKTQEKPMDKKVESTHSLKQDLEPKTPESKELDSKLESKLESNKESFTKPQEQTKQEQTKLQRELDSILKEGTKENLKDIKEKDAKEKGKDNKKENKPKQDTKITQKETINQIDSLQNTTTTPQNKIQDNFLDNLLKTKERNPQPVSEKEYEIPDKKQDKKEKIDSTPLQHSTHTQQESRMQIQQTFSSFSNSLRDAVLNYRPPVTKLSIALNPDNLGSIELTLTKSGDKISVQISSNQNALQLIAQNAQEFRNALNNLGFKEIEIDFKDNQGNSLNSGNFGDSNQGGFAQQQGQNSRNPRQDSNNSDNASQNNQNWNENSLQKNKVANNPYAKLEIVTLNFSYYA